MLSRELELECTGHQALGTRALVAAALVGRRPVGRMRRAMMRNLGAVAGMTILAVVMRNRLAGLRVSGRHGVAKPQR